ncbi:MAG: acyl-CoA dehydrogenase family protein [Candidatus Heimdallarchaeota archaeon]
MNFEFTPTQDALRKAAQEFAEKEVAPKAREIDEKAEFPWDILKKMARLSFMGVVVPREYGGAGLDYISRTIIVEELGRACASTAFTLSLDQLGMTPILNYGTEEQKQEYLPSLAKGEKLACFAFNEPVGGSDPLGMQTKAEQVGDQYILNGRKNFITNGSVAETCVTFAKTGEGAKGLSAFIVEKGTPGFTSGKQEKKIGLRGCDLSEVVFTDCEIPKKNLIGNEGDGLRIGLSSITIMGRLGISALALGVARAALDSAIKFAKERTLSGKSISNFQSIQFELAEIDMELEAAKWLTYYAAWLVDQGISRLDTQVARAKILATETARKAAVRAVGIYGGYGSLKDFPVERYLRDTIPMMSAAGTNHIQKVIISRSIFH